MNQERAPKILRVGTLVPPQDLDPRQASDFDSVFVLRQVVETAYAVVPGSTELVPALFAGPLEKRGSADQQVYLGRLRKDVFFSDGVPLEPRTVVDCLAGSALLQGFADVALDGELIKFTLKRPNARFDYLLSHNECSVFRRGGRDQPVIGTGPFALERVGKLSELRMVRNPHYRQPVALDELHLRCYPVDPDGAARSLRRAIDQGEVDVCAVLPRDEISQLSGVRKSFQPGLSTAMLFLNVESPHLGDARVRRAIAHGIDRLRMAESSYSNALAFRATSLIPRGMIAVDDGLGYDPARARALLDEAGFVAPKRLSILLPWGPRPYLPQPQATVDALRVQLEALGIELETIPTTSFADFFARSGQGRQDLALIGWTADILDPADFLEAVLRSDRVPTPQNLAISSNHARMVSPAMDAALDRFRAESSPASLSALFEVFRQQAPLVPLFHGAMAVVTSFRVLNYQPSPLADFSLAGLDLRS